MKSADSLGVKNAFSGSAIMQTFGKNQEIRTDKVEDFAKQVGASQAGDLDERFTISKILVDGNMASVWVPYQFYYKGNFSHCGVNSFQLAKINNEWKIQYIIDTRRKNVLDFIFCSDFLSVCRFFFFAFFNQLVLLREFRHFLKF